MHKHKKSIGTIIPLIVVILILTITSGCGVPVTESTTEAETTAGETDITVEESTEESAETVTVRTVAEREDAKLGEPITPSDFPAMFLPGIEKVGAVPLKKYKIALSNGDMANEWRRTFWEDIINFGNQYAERFGIEIISAASGNNSTKQIQDVQSLLAQQPDIVIMSPNESGPLSVVVELCEDAGVPLITVDRGLDKKPGEGAYISAIQVDGYLNGITNGIWIVKTLTEKYGEPKGDIAEIAGVLGSSVSVQRSQGVRRVIADYPNINVVTVRDGDFDRDKSFKAAQDILIVNPKGTLDGIVASCDTSAIAAIEAIKNAGRNELLGYIWTVDGLVEAIEEIVNGEIVQTNECPPYFGMVAFEYAIHYLNGVDIPSIVPVPQRDFAADTPEKKAKLEEIVKECNERGALFVPSDLGGYDVFVPPQDELNKYYPKPFWEQPDEWINEFEPYTVTK